MLNLTQSESEYARTLEETMNSFLNEEPFSNLNENDISAIKEKIRTYFLKKYQEENKERLLYEASAKPAVEMIATSLAHDACVKFFDANAKNASQHHAMQEILKKHMEAATLEILSRFGK